MIETKPLNEEECILARLPPKGTFPFRVLRTVEKNSAKVGEFFSLRLMVSLPDGKERQMFDALFFREDMLYKTRHFYRAVGAMNLYDSGKFHAEDCDGKEGYCEVDHRVNKQSGEIDGYIKDYVARDEVPQPEVPFFDDDIPI